MSRTTLSFTLSSSPPFASYNSSACRQSAPTTSVIGLFSTSSINVGIRLLSSNDERIFCILLAADFSLPSKTAHSNALFFSKNFLYIWRYFILASSSGNVFTTPGIFAKKSLTKFAATLSSRGKALTGPSVRATNAAESKATGSNNDCVVGSYLGYFHDKSLNFTKHLVCQFSSFSFIFQRMCQIIELSYKTGIW